MSKGTNTQNKISFIKRLRKTKKILLLKLSIFYLMININKTKEWVLKFKKKIRKLNQNKILL